MRQFFKFVFASCLGVFLAGIVLFFMLIWVGVSSLSTLKKVRASVEPNSVLVVKLDKALPERTNNVASVSFSDFNKGDVIGLQDMLTAIKRAKTDANIKGVYLKLAPEGAYGPATAAALRHALQDFKSSGKFIYAYADNYSQRAYYLSSVADKVFMSPVGNLTFNGMAAQIPFMKDLLDRIGLQMQVYYAGQFKSATEPLRYNKMSEQNRLQTREFLTDYFEVVLQDIATARNLSVAALADIAHHAKVRNAQDAVSYKMVDQLAYEDEVQAALRKRMGLGDNTTIKAVSLADYAADNEEPDFSVSDQIAVVYAEGDIVDGKGEDGNIGGDKYARIIERVRTNKGVKAIVLRVNSGGGSAQASEKIWRELILAKKAGLPVIVSMGDYAASGGYYISCMADSILAQQNTLTGSIGVFGVLPNASRLMEDKLGVHFDTVKIGQYATLGSPFYGNTPAEGEIIQQGVDEIYQLFLKRVADGRQMPTDAVHAVAQGRVWTGKRAIGNGLVDRIGGLDDAIAAAAKKANLKTYRLNEYPKTKDPLQKLLDDFSKQSEEEDLLKARVLQSELKAWYPYYRSVMQLMHTKMPQARLPYLISW